MKVGQPSRTAFATAYARAYHQTAAEPRVFTDPLAARIVDMTSDELTERDTATFDTGDADENLRRRLFIAARSRYAEDTIAAAVTAGTRQVVILGAGLDTFAYRNPYADVRVFEVDHPDTQAWKRQRLAEAGIEIPDSLTFTPVDFDRETLPAGLVTSGFDRTSPAVFAWLGVVMYLTSNIVMATLRVVAAQATPVQVIFDYLYPPSLAAPEARAAQQARLDRVAAIGEPFRTFFTAAGIRQHLLSIGFEQVEDHSAAALLSGYLGRPISGSGAGGVLCATRTR
ncbi:MAG: class I SAM-dependent methyltransferase [Pseudonocardiaceae bacterium]